MAKLGAVCIQITDGSHNPPSGVEQSEYLMLSSKNIDDDFITLDSPRFLSYSDYIAENKRTTVSEGDLLMTIVGTIGRVAIVPAGLNGICLQRSVAVIKPNKEIINNRYLMYQLQNMRSFLEKEARGVAQKGIYLKQVSQLDIKLPEIEQQKQIVKVLDKVSKLISLRKQQLAKLDELVKARFVEMFGDPSNNPMGWKKQNFEDIALLITDGEHMTPQRTNKGIYLLSARNILNHTIQLDDVDYIDEEEYGRIARRIVPQQGDVLVSCSGSIGRCCVVPSELKFQMVRSVALIRFNNTINPIFAEWLIATDELQKQIYTSATQSSQANLFQGKIRKLCGYVPPLSLQNQFAAFVERVDKQKQTVQQSLEKLELMKKALMQEYFG
ncbi:MAG: restriction endonuclease subunit S [Neglectibacter timonensis]